MPHVVLLGDSIFDNAAYVPGGEPVIEQMRGVLGSDWRATLLAVDGAITSNVPGQLARFPKDATHAIVSTGGNDALWNRQLLHLDNISARSAFKKLAQVQQDFRQSYADMLTRVLALGCKVAFCTIYDAIPGLDAREKAGLSIFNDIIISAAATSGCPILDLRVVCSDARDYSPLSPIEPSERGGAKIARAIQQLLVKHDFAQGHSVIYTG